MSSQNPDNDFPDEMYLPPEVSSLGDIIPMRVKRLVKAKPGDTIRCQWVGCQGEFKATATAIKHHFDNEHLKEYREKLKEIKKKKEESKEIKEEEEAVRIEEGEDEGNLMKEKEAEKPSEAIGVECLWLVNGRVPCKDLRRPGREDRAPKPYAIIAFEKHIGTHLYQEGLPSPYTKESKCCGHLYIGRGSGKLHEKECGKYHDGHRRKRAKLSHGEEQDADSD